MVAELVATGAGGASTASALLPRHGRQEPSATLHDRPRLPTRSTHSVTTRPRYWNRPVSPNHSPRSSRRRLTVVSRMQASPSSVTAPWNEKSGEGAVSSGVATDHTAAHSFQLPAAVLQELRPAMSMHSETTSPR